jgi:hypothetical protein
LEAGVFDGVAALREQAAQTKVVGGLATFLELAVAGSAPVSSCGDGPIPVRALVFGSADEITGELLVWVKEGYLSGFEHAWFTDKPPSEIPSPARVRVEPQQRS